MQSIDDAVVILKGHPAVSHVGELKKITNGYEVAVTIDVELPSRVRSAGITPNGILAQEPCWMVFSNEWPLKAPSVWLREDFPLNLPHINPHRAGHRVNPCLFEGSLHEVLHRFGLEKIVDQLSAWLSKAACGQLIDLEQGWEPTRRDYALSTVVFSAEEAIAKTPMDGSLLVTRGEYFTTGASLWAMAIDNLPSALTEFTQRHQQEQSLKWASGTLPFYFARCVDEAGVPRVVSDYSPETVVDLATLLEKATELGAKAELLQQVLSSYVFQMGLKRPTLPAGEANWSHGLFAVVVLLVHRPADLVGSPGRNVEVLPYAVKYILDEKNILEQTSQAHPAFHAQRISPALLSLASGLQAERKRLRLAILGCGSLGSKVALHLGRTGIGNVAFVDNEVFSPHNGARHALIPPGHPALIPNKSLLMEHAMRDLGHNDCDSHDLDAAKVLMEHEYANEVFGKGDVIVIDTTASLRVSVAAATSKPLDEEPCRRFAQAGMYAQGKVSYLLWEGHNRSVMADDLRAHLFEICRYDETMRSAMDAESSDPTRIFIGDNCRSLTMPMSDSRVSRAAALISGQLEKWLAGVPPSRGQLCYGIEDTSGIGMTWKREELLPTLTFPAKAINGWNVRVLEPLTRLIEIEAISYGQLETGGALLGHVSPSTRTIILAGLVEAPLDSTRSETKFILGTDGLASQLLKANIHSLGHLQFAGTWHSHPMGGPHSELDRQTLRAIAKDFAGLPAVSLVWTPSGFKCEVDIW